MKRPWRSPIEIPDLVKKYLHGKIFCEIGCCEGDLLEQFAKYADKAIGLEISQSYEPKLRELENKYNNIEILIGDIFQMEDRVFRLPDVFYFWITPEVDSEIIKLVPDGSTIIIHKALKNKPWLESAFEGLGETKYIEFLSKEEPNWPRPEDNITINTQLVIGILMKNDKKTGR